MAMEVIRLRPRISQLVITAIAAVAAVAVVVISPPARPHVRTLEGRITNETGAPIPLARVCAVAPLPTCTVSGPTGDYRINDVSGDAVIDVVAPRYVLAHRTRSPRSTAEHAVVDVDMRRGGRLLVGVVRDTAGHPIRDAYVIAGDALALADGEGRYELWLAGGRATAAARGYARHTARVDSAGPTRLRARAGGDTRRHRRRCDDRQTRCRRARDARVEPQQLGSVA